MYIDRESLLGFITVGTISVVNILDSFLGIFVKGDKNEVIGVL